MGYYGFLRLVSIGTIFDLINKIKKNESKKEHLFYEIVIKILPDKL